MNNRLNRAPTSARTLLLSLVFMASLGADATRVDARTGSPSGDADARASDAISEWQEQKVSAADGAADDNFGYAVAISGTTAVVGASNAGGDGRGAACVYVLVDDVWTLQQELSADDGAALDGFGFSASVSGDTIVIGAPYATIGDNGGEGAAYVFSRSGDTWTQVQKLEPDDGTSNFNFGWSVAVSGSTALISSPVAPVGDNALQGKAYIFENAGGAWTQMQTLLADDGSAMATFGSSVALDGTQAIIGAAGVDGYFGAAYIFDGSGGTWTQTAHLSPDDGVQTEFFGLSVAISGSKALVGAYYQRVDGHNGQGSAYVFSDDGGTWAQQQKLLASDGAAGARFGLSVALDGTTALVGSYFATVDGNSQQGAAYVFSEIGDTWNETDKLVASDGAAGDHFGNAVALASGTALIGAFDAAPGGATSQGAAYFYSQPSNDAIFVDGFDGGALDLRQ
ncbi:MAG: FG-GAP repeat protein [Rhodanobacteraceae bacterium]